MNGVSSGLDRAIKIFIGGIIAVAIIRSFLGAYDLEYLVIIFDLASIIGIVLLFDKMKYWSFSYLIGWSIGLFIFYSILSPIEIIVYFFVFIITFIVKFKNKIADIID